MDSSLKKFLNQYFNFKIAGKQVTIPYWMNKLDKGIYGPYGGKGTCDEIKQATVEEAAKAKIDLKKLTPEGIYSFMKKKKIGLDCSGYAYQILNFLDYNRGGDGLDNSIIGVNGSGIRRTNADALTSNINSLPVEDYAMIKPGDMIRHMGGKHILVIVDCKEDVVTYTHIDKFTKTEGPHLAQIKIIDNTKPLGEQEWQELTKENQNYGKKYFHAHLGDGVRRFKVWA